MLIYTQPGNCPNCGKPLSVQRSDYKNSTSTPIDLYLCTNCNSNDVSSVAVVMSTESNESYNKMKRRVALWDDLKQVLKNGTWKCQDTIDAVLTNMEYMEYASNHTVGKNTDAQ